MLTLSLQDGQISLDVFQDIQSSLRMQSKPISKLILRDRLVGSSYRQMRGQMMLMFQSIIDQWYAFVKLCTGIQMQAQCGSSTVTNRYTNLVLNQLAKNGLQRVFIHEAMKLLLLLAGPTENMSKGWSML